MLAGPISGGFAIQLIGWPSLYISWPLLLVSMAVGRMIEVVHRNLRAVHAEPPVGRHRRPPRRAKVMAWYEMATLVGIAVASSRPWCSGTGRDTARFPS